jgi:hypothetical protein
MLDGWLVYGLRCQEMQVQKANEAETAQEEIEDKQKVL